ncbi:MAG TPA: AarF/ABC1/UbiB kinase family protein [Thermoanaerobaculia bacterium]|nr:AarF/ABC1/UbiB kinase family protein [Thermoanaerobaculia bacterium]
MALAETVVETVAPRHTPLDVQGAPSESAQLGAATKLPKPGAIAIVLRWFRWAGAGLLLTLRLAWDAVRGRRSPRNFARRLRQMFESGGGAAARLGQRLSLRVDLLSFEVCDELSRCRSDSTPLDIRYVVERIEAAAKAPLATIFEVFDPTPVHTGTLTSIYNGVLRGGRQVAVKIRRPRMAEEMTADLRCIESFTYIPELLTLVRPRLFQQLRDGLRQIVVDETDLRREARYQRIFRRWAKKQRLDWVTAPKVHTSLSSSDVLVTDYVDGVLVSELLHIARTNDDDALRTLEDCGITPERIARRLFRVQYRSYLDALFFLTEPNPNDVMIEPDGRLVFLDFGSCTSISTALRRNLQELIERALRDDAAGMSEVALMLLSPLPRIDVYELRKALEASFHRYLFALRDKRSRWWEHAPAGIWFALLDAMRQFDLPVRVDVLRLARAALLFDAMTFPLCALRFRREYRRMSRQSQDERADKILRRAEKELPGARDQLTVFGAKVRGIERQAAWTFSVLAQDRPVEMVATVKKAAYAFQALLHFLVKSAVIEGVAAGLGLMWRAMSSQRAGTAFEFLRQHVFFHPIVTGLIAVNALIMIRRILLRLGESDQRNDRDSPV